MRFISVNDLKEGMIIGKPFYGQTGYLLIQSGLALTAPVIAKLKYLGYMGLYIEDAFSEGLDIENVISPETRSKAGKSVRKLMTAAAKKKAVLFSEAVKDVLEVLNQVIDEITGSGSVIINIIDMKGYDAYTYQHSINVCVLSCVIGMGFDLNRDQLYKLALSAMLHDLGNLFIDKEILDKPGKLTADEYEVIKTHTAIGVDQLKLRYFFPSSVIAPIIQHHERFDGGGYPFGRKGAEIPLNAQIISISDIYDAFTSNRPYRKAHPVTEAYEYILGNAGQAFGAELVKSFTKKIAPFPLGVQVLLSNGRKGIVFKHHEDNLIRPLIKLEPTPEQPDECFIDLNNDVESYHITVEKVLI
ncbi:MAG: HD-GYP domain-containing protein [Oscillospiraceae bacterium]|jgi:HD-GYP domain-containing protein (c-di-GMP phosphodiesterase class II)|nr:HD-GYP domain-containing protein [Oscillospiraceae bacterium]